MQVSVLGSGSKGNCVFVRADDTRLLFDAGFSRKQIRERLESIGENLEDIDAIFVSHEHSDHVRGLTQLSKAIPVYLSEGTYHASSTEIQNHIFFTHHDKIRIGDITVEPIPTDHDAADPSGFVIRNCTKNVGIFTDLGVVTDQICTLIDSLDLMVLECNYDMDMLLNGPYPYPLKQRILGQEGHLSNADAALLVKEHAGPRLKHVFLAHLSEKNNEPRLAMDTFKKVVGNKINCYLTNQKKATEKIKI